MVCLAADRENNAFPFALALLNLRPVKICWLELITRLSGIYGYSPELRAVSKVRAGEGSAVLTSEVSLGESTPTRELRDERELNDLLLSVQAQYQSI